MINNITNQNTDVRFNEKSNLVVIIKEKKNILSRPENITRSNWIEWFRRNIKVYNLLKGYPKGRYYVHSL
jgi:hypothetical protein